MRKYRGVGVDKQLKVVYNFLDMISSRPEDSAIFMVPSHKHINGTILRIIFMALVPEDIILVVKSILFIIPKITPSKRKINHI